MLQRLYPVTHFPGLILSGSLTVVAPAPLDTFVQSQSQPRQTIISLIGPEADLESRGMIVTLYSNICPDAGIVNEESPALPVSGVTLVSSPPGVTLVSSPWCHPPPDNPGHCERSS